MTRRGLPCRIREDWTADQIETLRLNYADFPTFLVAHVCGHTITSTYQKATKLGLKKSAAYLETEWACRLRRGENVGAEHRFTKGQTPPNKGLRRPGWAPGRMRETQFKKGRPAHESRNYKPIGSLRVTSDGLLERKVTDDPNLVPARRWVGVHRLVWEEANGPIPPGHAVVFKPDRRTTDPGLITVDALELVTRAELGRRNIHHNRYPKEVCQLIALKGALNRKINRRTRENEEQDGGRTKPPGRDARRAGRPEGRRQRDRAR